MNRIQAMRPKRAYRLTLAMEADTPEALANAMWNMSMRIEQGELGTGMSGAPSDGSIYELLHDPAQTHETYFQQVREYLRRKRPTNEPGDGNEVGPAAPKMVEVTQEDANNYCRVLAHLGIEDEATDPVAAIQMVQSWEADAQKRSELLAQHLLAVLEIARTWQPDYATKMDRDTLDIAAAEVGMKHA